MNGDTLIELIVDATEPAIRSIHEAALTKAAAQPLPAGLGTKTAPDPMADESALRRLEALTRPVLQDMAVMIARAIVERAYRANPGDPKFRIAEIPELCEVLDAEASVEVGVGQKRGAFRRMGEVLASIIRDRGPLYAVINDRPVWIVQK